jgi:glycosyltransferase involved in cell wall biosynthesis
MRIAHISFVETGSSGNILNQLHQRLIENKFSSFVIYGLNNNIKSKNSYFLIPKFVQRINSIFCNLTGFAFIPIFSPHRKIKRLLLEINPNIIHLHLLNGYFVNVYKLFKILGDLNLPVVITNHAEFLYTGGCSYTLGCKRYEIGCGSCPQKGLNKPASILFDRSNIEWEMLVNSTKDTQNFTYVFVSEFLLNNAISSPILINRKKLVIWNGIDESIFHYRINKKDSNLQQKVLGMSSILFVAPRLDDKIKGFGELLKLSRLTIDLPLIFIVIGDDSNLDSKSYPSNFVFLGTVSDKTKMAEIYSLADVTLILSQVETFSMVMIESLSCGTPVVGFDVGAMKKIALNEYSSFVEPGDLYAVLDAINLHIKTGYNKHEISRIAHQSYSFNNTYKSYLGLYNDLLI